MSDQKQQEQPDPVYVETDYVFDGGVLRVTTSLPGVGIVVTLDYRVEEGPENADLLVQALFQVVGACIERANDEAGEDQPEEGYYRHG